VSQRKRIASEQSAEFRVTTNVPAAEPCLKPCENQPDEHAGFTNGSVANHHTFDVLHPERWTRSAVKRARRGGTCRRTAIARARGLLRKNGLQQKSSERRKELRLVAADFALTLRGAVNHATKTAMRFENNGGAVEKRASNEKFRIPRTKPTQCAARQLPVRFLASFMVEMERPGECVPTGVCEDMCPSQEAAFRTENGLTSVCEGGPGAALRLVKRFARPAAGHQLQAAEDLRPAPVLQRTMRHLFEEVLARSPVPLTAKYGFLSDRMRAIRQDAVIQRLRGGAVEGMLQSMLTFHALAAYLFCGLGFEGSPADRIGALAESPAGPTASPTLGFKGDDAAYDAVLNDSRLMDTLATLAEAGVEPAIRLRASCARVCMSLLDAAEIHLLVSSTEAAFAAKSCSPLLGRLWLGVCEAASSWVCQRWHGFLAAVANITQLCGGGDSTEGEAPALDADWVVALACRALLHRYQPVARMQLLQELNTSVLGRSGYPLSDLARVLHLDVSDGALRASSRLAALIAAVSTESTGDGVVSDRPAPAVHDGVAACAAAQLCMQLRLDVRWHVDPACVPAGVTATVLGHAAATDATLLHGVLMDSASLMRLRAALRDTRGDAAWMNPLDLRVALDRNRVLDPSMAASDMRVMVALTPCRDDDAFGWPVAASSEASCGRLLAALCSVSLLSS